MGQTDFVGYLATTRLGEKGQMTIPKEFREALRLEAGAPISVLQFGPSLILIPEHARFAGIGNMQGILVDLATGTMTAGADPRRSGYAIGW